jgi:hypothetical protein
VMTPMSVGVSLYVVLAVMASPSARRAITKLQVL